MYLTKKSITCARTYAGISLLILGACATVNPALEGRLDPKLGSAVKANVQAHGVAPTAQQKANTYIPADPSRAALAHKNYRENTVDDPILDNQSTN